VRLPIGVSVFHRTPSMSSIRDFMVGGSIWENNRGRQESAPIYHFLVGISSTWSTSPYSTAWVASR
jgi:hypothetical protein